MADNKRFYWIKLKTNFFGRDEIDFLLSQKNGAEYVVLYQMLCLNTANNDGRLESKIGEILVPYNADKIVRDCKYFDIDTVNIAMALYKKLGLIYEEQDGVLKISNYEEMVGSETSSAQRVRDWRKKKLLQCNQDVTYIETQENRDKSIENRDIDNRVSDIDINNGDLSDGCQMVAKRLPQDSIDKNSKEEISIDKNKLIKQFNEEFEKLWSYYPNKKGKDQAKTKYISARKNGTTYEEVAQGLKNYIAYCNHEKIEIKFIKHGSTWFNQRCWKDDYSINTSNKTKVDNQMEILKGVHNGEIKVN